MLNNELALSPVKTCRLFRNIFLQDMKKGLYSLFLQCSFILTMPQRTHKRTHYKLQNRNNYSVVQSHTSRYKSSFNYLVHFTCLELSGGIYNLHLIGASPDLRRNFLL